MLRYHSVAFFFCLFITLTTTGISFASDNNNIAPRVVGGSKVLIAKPWMASIQNQPSGRLITYFCGGTLIAPQWVLTAAHCLENSEKNGYKPASSIRVEVGIRDLGQFEGEAINIEDYYIPKNFKADFIADNDIALLKLERASQFQPLPIASLTEVNGLLPFTDTQVFGWGRTQSGEQNSSVTILNSVTIPLRSKRDCLAAHGNNFDDQLLCAGALQGGRDACLGDSGGPMITEFNGVEKQIGIVSFGFADIPCGDPRSLGAYTKVAAYSDWINQTLAGNNSPVKVTQSDNLLLTAGKGGGSLSQFLLGLLVLTSLAKVFRNRA